MDIIDHGKWLLYKSSKPDPRFGPFNVMLMRRERDGVDWYDYVNKGKNFKPDSVKIMAIWRDSANGYVIGPAVHDATKLCPSDHIVIEITDYPGDDPQKEFGNKVYDPKTASFTEQALPPRPPDLTQVVQALQARIEELEKRG